MYCVPSDDPLANEILQMLGITGVKRSDIINHLDRNTRASKIDAALGKLLEAGKVRREVQMHASGLGRPAEVWFAVA